MTLNGPFEDSHQHVQPLLHSGFFDTPEEETVCRYKNYRLPGINLVSGG